MLGGAQGLFGRVGAVDATRGSNDCVEAGDAGHAQDLGRIAADHSRPVTQQALHGLIAELADADADGIEHPGTAMHARGGRRHLAAFQEAA